MQEDGLACVGSTCARPRWYDATPTSIPSPARYPIPHSLSSRCAAVAAASLFVYGLACVAPGPSWSPDGTRLAVVLPTGKGAAEVVLVDRSGKMLRRFPRTEGESISGAVAWSSDAKFLAWLEFHKVDGAKAEVRLWIQPVEGDPRRAAARLEVVEAGDNEKGAAVRARLNRAPVWLDHARRFAHHVPSRERIVLTDPDGNDDGEVACGEALHAELSPDGAWVAKLVKRPGEMSRAYVLAPRRENGIGTELELGVCAVPDPREGSTEIFPWPSPTWGAGGVLTAGWDGTTGIVTRHTTAGEARIVWTRAGWIPCAIACARDGSVLVESKPIPTRDGGDNVSYAVVELIRPAGATLIVHSGRSAEHGPLGSSLSPDATRFSCLVRGETAEAGAQVVLVELATGALTVLDAPVPLGTSALEQALEDRLLGICYWGDTFGTGPIAQAIDFRRRGAMDLARAHELLREAMAADRPATTRAAARYARAWMCVDVVASAVDKAAATTDARTAIRELAAEEPDHRLLIRLQRRLDLPTQAAPRR